MNTFSRINLPPNSQTSSPSTSHSNVHHHGESIYFWCRNRNRPSSANAILTNESDASIGASLITAKTFGSPLYDRKKINDEACSYVTEILKKSGLHAVPQWEPDGFLARAWVAEDETISPPESSAAKEQVRRVFNLFACSYGNGNGGFTTPHLKNLMALLWSFELQLNLIHPKPWLNNPTCMGLRSSSKLAHELEEGRCSVSDGLKILLALDDEPETVENIVDIFQSTLTTEKALMRCNYNICFLWRQRFFHVEEDDPRKPIKFRQHEGTLDPERINHWVTMCVEIVDYAQGAETKELQEFCMLHCENSVEDFSVVDLLTKIGLPVEARYYGLRLFMQKQEDREKKRARKDEEGSEAGQKSEGKGV
ncbi:hypothetical protein B0J14DRAFT_559583 [Halenospora varia]|nr:hypothetical protein B0J14DRAFT_559583 [Halenospora varia]